MPRYIDADKIADWSLEQFGVVIPEYYDIIDAEELTVDVAPVVHAHWIERQLSERGEFEFCCSNCEHTYYGYDIPGNYCPDCGALMDEEVS